MNKITHAQTEYVHTHTPYIHTHKYMKFNIKKKKLVNLEPILCYNIFEDWFQLKY